MEENRIDSSASVSSSHKILIAGLWLQRALELGRWDLNTIRGAGCVCVAGDCARSCTARLPPIHSLPAPLERLGGRGREAKQGQRSCTQAGSAEPRRPRRPSRGAVWLGEQHTQSSVPATAPW